MNTKEFNHPHYVNTPFFILQDEKLDFFNKYLFALFWSFSISGRKIIISNEYLATLFKVTERHIQDRIKFLEDNLYIARFTIKNKRFIKVLKKVDEDIENPPDPNDQTSESKGVNHSSGGGEPQFTPGTNHSSPYIKDYNKDNKTYTDAKAPPVDKSVSLTIDDLLKDNPHELTKQSLQDWILVRKRKKAELTLTAWNGTNKMLSALVEKGLTAKYCFEHMVSSGWQGIKLSYFEDDIKKLGSKAHKFHIADKRKNDIDRKNQYAEERKSVQAICTKALGIQSHALLKTLGAR